MMGIIAVDESVLDAIKALNTRVIDLTDEVRKLRVKPDPQWLPVRDYAEYVGKSVSTVNKWITDGQVCMKIEGKTRMVRVDG